MPLPLCEDLITFRSQSLQLLDDLGQPLIYFDLLQGYSEPVRVKGDDWNVPGAEGRIWMPKIEDSLLLELDGFARGQGADLSERQASWRDQSDILRSLFSLTAAPGTLALLAPYLGLEDDVSIDAATINVVTGPVLSNMTYQRWNVKLEAFDPAFEVAS